MSEQDGDERPPEPSEQTRPVYGTPSSPSYGRWGSGQAGWTTPEPREPETSAIPPAPPTMPFGGSWTSPTPPPAPGYGSYGPAPGYGWYPTPPRLHRTRGMAVAVIAVTGLATLLTWVAAFLAPHGSFLYTVDSRNIQQLPDPLLRYLSIEIYGVGLLMLAGWVLTSIWLSQVRDNALAFNPTGQRRSAVWTWLGWIVPIVAFWYPKQILDDSIQATVQAAGRPASIRTAPFWAAWLVWFLQLLIVHPITGHAMTNEVGRLQQVVLTVRPGLQVVSAVLATITFVLWALLVRQVSAAQDELVTGPGGLSGPAGPGGFRS